MKHHSPKRYSLIWCSDDDGREHCFMYKISHMSSTMFGTGEKQFKTIKPFSDPLFPV